MAKTIQRQIKDFLRCLLPDTRPRLYYTQMQTHLIKNTRERFTKNGLGFIWFMRWTICASYNTIILELRKQEGKEMVIQKCIKESFAVIGKEGSTSDGEGFIQRLWSDANSHFSEVSALAKKDELGNLMGIWGIMTDHSRTFKPWEDGFTKGLYLAGVECDYSAEGPEGWTKWVIPGFEYIYVECDSNTVFADMIQYLNDCKLSLAGAVHDYTCPQTGRNYMFFPIRKL